MNRGCGLIVAVADTILRGIAKYHQASIIGTAGDDDAVITTAAVDNGNRAIQGITDGDALVSAAKQDIDDFEAAQGNATTVGHGYGTVIEDQVAAHLESGQRNARVDHPAAIVHKANIATAVIAMEHIQGVGIQGIVGCPLFRIDEFIEFTRQYDRRGQGSVLALDRITLDNQWSVDGIQILRRRREFHDQDIAIGIAGNDLLGDVSHHVDVVIAGTADDDGDQVSAGTQDEDRIIAFQGIEFSTFYIVEADIETGAHDAVFGNDEVIREWGTEDDDGIETVTAIDADRGVDRVLDTV